jgi:DNA-binding transcriptional ArsR family regulator
MIALPNQLPHVVWQNDRLVPLYEGWVAETIAIAAHRVGFQDWEATTDVARAILHFLRQEYAGTTIKAEDLSMMIRRSLTGIGQGNIARHIDLVPPRVSIFLPELAHRTGYEILFFPSLREQILQAVSYSVRAVKLEGVRDCVKILDRAQKWRNGCRDLEEQIVAFSRESLRVAQPGSVDLVVC